MPTKLETLLAQIDPSRTLDEAASRVDRAVNRFSGAKGRVTAYDEYTDLAGQFLAHVEARVLGIPSMYGSEPDMFQRRAMQLLNDIWGSSGWKASFEMARTGAEGGLRQVLNKMAEQLALTYARNEIGARVYTYWDGLSTTEKLAAADEYLAKFAHLLPGELTEGSAVRVRMNLPEILIEHPFLMRKTRRVGR